MIDSRIREVVNETLSAVAFVQDYVELHFDGKIVRAFGALTVLRKGQSIHTYDSGWRDALCGLVGISVRDLAFFNNVPARLVVSFKNGTELVATLAVDDESGPEALHYVPGDNEPIEVW